MMNKPSVFKLAILLVTLTCSPVAKSQHDAHREAVIEIASGQHGEALQRIENVAQNPSALWRSLTNAYTRAGQTIRNEGEEYRRFVIPENNFVMSMLYSIKGDADKSMDYAKAAVEAGMPFERLLAGPRYAFATLYDTREFKEWSEKEASILIHGPMLGNVTNEGASFLTYPGKGDPGRFRVAYGGGAG